MKLNMSIELTSNTSLTEVSRRRKYMILSELIFQIAGKSNTVVGYDIIHASLQK